MKKRQEYIEGTAPPPRREIKAIENAAVSYVEKRDARMQLLREEIGAREILEAAMRSEGISVYECDDGRLLVELVSSEKAKVTVAKDEIEE
jgi:hypothetical protein